MVRKKLHIAQLRKQHGMSQADLALRLGMSRPTLLRTEKGERELTHAEEQALRDIFAIAGEHTAPVDMRISIPQKKLDKFKQVLLYVLEKVGAKPNIGMTALYKLLYFIDFDYYEKYEEQLMGLTYIRNHHGPTPREFVAVVDDMKKQGELEEVKSTYYTYEQKKFLPRTSANLTLLSAQELAHIDNELARLSDKSAKELSELSHLDMPYISAQQGEELLYNGVFYRDEKLSVRDYDAL